MSEGNIDRQIQDAVNAHAGWKTRLRRAANGGEADFDVAQIRRDDVCAFGKWLYGIPPGTVAPGRVEKIKRMHRDFHGEAARVAEMILAGRKDEAMAAFGIDAPFTNLSAALVGELSAWRASL